MNIPSAVLVLPPLGDPVPEAKDVTPGWLYAVVFLALCVVTVLLWMSMRKQLGKIHFGDKSDSSVNADSSVKSDSDTQDPPVAT